MWMKQTKVGRRITALLLCLLLLAAMGLGSWNTLEPVAAAAVSLETGHQTLGVGESRQLSLTGGAGTVRWSSSDPSVASVTQEGVVSAHRMGQAVITAADSSGNSAACTITSGYYWGIDLSRHNGSCDWAAIARAGVDFAMIRAGYGSENYPDQVDSQVRANVEGAVSNGIPFGLYFYSYAATPAQASLEADYLLRILDDYVAEYRGNLVLPIAYDVEESRIINNLDVNTVNQMVITFCDKVRDAGYLPMLYSYRNMIATSMNLSDLQQEGILIWEAYWPSQPDFTQKHSLPGQEGVSPDIWQYTSDGNVPGANTASGRVDLNLIYMDSTLGRLLGGGDLLAINGVTVDGAGILNWNRQLNAQSFEVHRVGPDSRDVTLAVLEGETTSYLDNTLGWAEGSYTYYLKSISQDGTSMESNRISLTSQQKNYQAQAASYPAADTLVWSRVNGADRYLIYRNTVQVASLDAGVQEYPLGQGEDGVYTVRALFHCADGNVLYYDLLQGGVLGSAEPAGVTPTLTGRDGASYAQLSWTSDPAASGYQIWRNGAYFDWVEGETAQYTLYFQPGQVDTYQVAAHYTAADGTVRLGPLSRPVYTAFLPEGVLEQPFSLTAQPGEDFISLSWQELPYAQGYRVLLNGEEAAVTQDTALILDSLAPNAAYEVEVLPLYFTWQGETPGTGAAVQIVLSESGSWELKAPQVTAQNGETQVSLSWQPVENAAGYEIYRDGVLAAQTQQTAWQDGEVALAQPHTYTVRAYAYQQEQAVYSPLSQPVTAQRQVQVPDGVENLTAQTRFDRVTLSWDGSALATGYEIYRDGALLARTDQTSYEDAAVSAATGYTYTVVPVRQVEEVTASGAEAILEVQTPAPLVGAGTLVLMGAQDTGVKVTPNLSANDGGLVQPEGWLLYRDGELVTSLDLEESYTFYQDTLAQQHQYWIVGYFFDRDGRLWLSQPV